MKRFLISVSLILFVSLIGIKAQSVQNDRTIPPVNQQQISIENISQEIAKIAKSVETLNERLKTFSETFTSNQGLRLTDRQQKLLIAFEFLNRSEQRLATLQKLSIDLTEKQTTIRRRLDRIDEDLRPDNIGRSVAVLGTTNADELRTMRQQAFFKEKTGLNVLLNEIQKTLYETNTEIRQTELFLRNLRQRIFPEIEKELADL
jgi:hypothetical protein